MGGSSPLTRGKRESLNKSCTMLRAHPRSRGENRADGQAGQRTWGSSPLTRGKQLLIGFVGDRGGSSPLTRGKHLMST